LLARKNEGAGVVVVARPLHFCADDHFSLGRRVEFMMCVPAVKLKVSGCDGEVLSFSRRWRRYTQSGSNMRMKRLLALGLDLFVTLVGLHSALAWDYEGHRVVNELALASLPTNFPSFVRTPEATERIAFLAGEADRWRNTPDLPLQHCQEPEHFMDMEELAQFGLKPEALPIFRYDFISELAAYRKTHPENFPAADSASDPAHKHSWVGLLPWVITENYGKLKSEFSYLKAFEQDGGTAEEIANAQANVLYTMGVMGHHVGDASQPLHTTIHHHGWKGENPHHYSTRESIHGWIDGGYFRKIGGANLKEMQSKLRPAQLVSINGRAAKPEEMFQAVMSFILEQHKLVEPLYQLDQEGKLSGEGEVGMQGRVFLEGQLMKSGQLLGDIWYSAWQQAPPDTFLKSQLVRRKGKEAPNPKSQAPEKPQSSSTKAE